MTNSLNADLTGKVIIVTRDALRPQHRHHYKCRLFKVTGGPGAQSSTGGTDLLGEFLCDGEKGRINSYQVVRFATDEDIKTGWRGVGMQQGGGAL